jgi:hypothetical protein
MNTLTELPIANRERWPDGFPHREWNYQSIDDHGSADHRCQYCKKQQVRYVHELSHTDWPESIYVGCDCAEKLTGTNESNEWEREARKRAARKKTFIMGGWNVAQYGGLWKKHKGAHVMVARNGPQWKVWIDRYKYEANFESEDAAKTFAYSILDKPVAELIRLSNFDRSRN